MFICLLAMSVIACQDDKKSSSEELTSEDDVIEKISSKEQERDLQTNEHDEEIVEVQEEENVSSTSKNDRPGPSAIWSGEFIKTNALRNDAACNCNCLDIDFNAARTLCLDKKSGIDIQVNYKLKGKIIEVIYLNGKGNLDDKNPIPWSDFDKNSVVAEISTTGNQMQLDWKGFTIDNKLATNYAILGKKNLEGNYKRK